MKFVILFSIFLSTDSFSVPSGTFLNIIFYFKTQLPKNTWQFEWAFSHTRKRICNFICERRPQTWTPLDAEKKFPFVLLLAANHSTNESTITLFRKSMDESTCFSFSKYNLQTTPLSENRHKYDYRMTRKYN